MKKYKLYLFDFDMTLFNTLPSVIGVYLNTFKHFGIESNETECADYIKLSLPATMEAKNMDLSLKTEFIDTFHFYLNSPEVVSKTLIYNDTKECLEFLKTNNIPFGIVTGNSYRHMKNVFAFHGMNIDDASVIVGNETFKKPKPDPDACLIAISKYPTIDKTDIMYIGDSLSDEKCATGAGVNFLYIDRENDREGAIKNLMELFK